MNNLEARIAAKVVAVERQKFLNAMHKTVKDQLNRLAAADFRLGVSKDSRAVTMKGTVIEALELWAPKAFVPWSSLKEQFGPDYDRMDNFERVFRTTLKQVATVYKDAKYSMDDKGMRLKTAVRPC